jgi:hypothetical protein
LVSFGCSQANLEETPRALCISLKARFSYLSSDAMVPKGHPLRVIRPLVNAALIRLSPDFEWPYAPTGRASIAPEKLLRVLAHAAEHGHVLLATQWSIRACGAVGGM